MTDHVIFIVSLIALGVSLLALFITITSGSTEQHFYAHSQCSRVLGQDGQERDSWSFSSGHSNALIGRTIGPIYIAMARAKHNRLERRSAAADQVAQ